MLRLSSAWLQYCFHPVLNQPQNSTDLKQDRNSAVKITGSWAVSCLLSQKTVSFQLSPTDLLSRRRTFGTAERRNDEHRISSSLPGRGGASRNSRSNSIAVPEKNTQPCPELYRSSTLRTPRSSSVCFQYSSVVLAVSAEPVPL